jgi:hypothetical protein
MPQAPRRPQRETREPDEVRTNLRIDEDDLDRCLVAQPEYFYQAAIAATAANAARDMLELELKELTAELDQDIREELGRLEARFTEAGITNKLRTLPRIKEKQRACLAARREADDAQALKEAFIQRSYALKDLTAIQLSRLNNLGIERGATSARRNVGDQIGDRVEAARIARDRSSDRYRPQDRGD